MLCKVVLKVYFLFPKMIWESFLAVGIVYDLLGSTIHDGLVRLVGGPIQGHLSGGRVSCPARWI